MLEAIPTSLFSKNIRLQQQNELVGEVDVSVWREKARLELQEGTYELRREGFCSGDFLLEQDGKVIARATKTSRCGIGASGCSKARGKSAAFILRGFSASARASIFRQIGRWQAARSFSGSPFSSGSDRTRPPLPSERVHTLYLISA